MSRECPIESRRRAPHLLDRWRWPRRRSRFPGRGRLLELIRDPTSTVARARPTRLGRVGRLDDADRLIGMLMVRDEDDVLAETLATAVQWFDRIYLLDGTTDPDRVERTDAIVARHPEVVWHTRDGEWFPAGVTDGARQVLLDRIRSENGVDNWIGLLHADEFLDQDPRPMLAARHPSSHPSLRVRVAHTFLHVDDAYRWDDEGPIAMRRRVAHLMWPGVPESRFFFDDGSRDFELVRHSKVVPRSHRAGELVDGYVIVQYNERSPEQVVARARQRIDSGWQVGHYARFAADDPEIFIPTLDRPDAAFAPEFAGDPDGPFEVLPVTAVPQGPAPHISPPAIETELTGPDELAALEAAGRRRRDLMALVEPAGLIDLMHRGSRRAQCRAVRKLRRPGALGHTDAVIGAEPLIRHTVNIVSSRRTTDAQRHAAVAECVVRLCNAGSGQSGWFAVIPANRKPALCTFFGWPDGDRA